MHPSLGEHGFLSGRKSTLLLTCSVQWPALPVAGSYLVLITSGLCHTQNHTNKHAFLQSTSSPVHADHAQGPGDTSIRRSSEQASVEQRPPNPKSSDNLGGDGKADLSMQGSEDGEESVVSCCVLKIEVTEWLCWRVTPGS